MKIYISYFYQIRFMNKDLLPVSTAKWDPRWYHDWCDQTHTYKDKNGVINGARMDILALPESEYNLLQKENASCDGCKCIISGAWCEFMKLYYDYLNNIDFEKIFMDLKLLAMGYEAKDIVLIVHEAASKPCAERPVLVRLFKEHGIDVEEWNKEKYYEKTNIF